MEKELLSKPGEEINKEDLLKMSEISLWLDTYEDIFSDFDPRPYQQRSLSVDFLEEAKRASKEKVSGKIELKFLVPARMKEEDTENKIKKRLKEHFKKHYDLILKERKKLIKNGILFTFIGSLLMIIDAFTLLIVKKEIIAVILTGFFQPAGWFMAWAGLDKIFFSPKSLRQDIEFYEKMSKSEMSFIYY